MSPLDVIAQIGISVLGITAIILVSRKNKWGFVFGLLSQPFWFTTAYLNSQWGVFFLSLIYTGSWAYGIWEWFFKPQPRRM
jgi:nicotinamide riboside transporter PnuC